jgi:EAL domain-containing protein (putative c-di-GMP-specific phosphodiesterase class I)
MTGESGELLPAASFIETAERSGMVQELDRWVVARALEMLAERERAGDPVSLHVNLSGASLTDISVLEFIERRLDEGDADPGRCTFEITKSAQLEDYATAAGFADRLTEFGCEVAIDDYGAGFSPFHYLKTIPFDVIKIDGAFIRNMPRNDADQLTVKAIVEIARGLGKRTIAGFVQDDETMRMLRAYGVDMAQGYHLGRPVDSAEGLAPA